MKLRNFLVTQKKKNEKNSNDVESSHFNAFLSSLSFDHSKSNNQKNLNSFESFFLSQT